MQRSYRIGKYEFKDAISYYAGKKDLETIKYIEQILPLTEDNAEAICNLIKREDISFHSCIGTDYLKRLNSYMHKQRKDSKRKYYLQKFVNINVNVIMGILGTLIICVFLYASGVVRGIYSSNENIEELKDKVGVNVHKRDLYIDNTEIDELSVLPQYEVLHEGNEDFAGWLTIEGTNIDYPVMWRNGDNQYYLEHNYDGMEDANGLLVLDYRCDIENSNTNYLIHGHNMKSGMMFGALRQYKNEEFFEQHRYISFDTIYEIGEYEVIAVFVSQVMESEEEAFKYYECLEFRDIQEYQTFLDNIRNMSLYETGVESQYGDTFIMLSTCDYSKENGRLVVIAKKMEV